MPHLFISFRGQAVPEKLGSPNNASLATDTDFFYFLISAFLIENYLNCITGSLPS